MATFISLINWTDQGIRSVRDTTDRANAATDLAKKFGGELREIYWTLGPYDVVAITEFPDDESYTAFALAIGSQGNVRTSSLRAFRAEEMSQVVARLG